MDGFFVDSFYVEVGELEVEGIAVGKEELSSNPKPTCSRLECEKVDQRIRNRAEKINDGFNSIYNV